MLYCLLPHERTHTMIYDDYDDSYDIRLLQKLLPTYANMSEKEIRRIISKIAKAEREQWEEEVRAMLADQRKKTMDYIAALEAGEGKDYEKTLPSEPVEIQRGIKVHPTLLDDQGFISNEDLSGQKRMFKMSLGKKKIYL